MFRNQGFAFRNQGLAKQNTRKHGKRERMKQHRTTKREAKSKTIKNTSTKPTTLISYSKQIPTTHKQTLLAKPSRPSPPGHELEDFAPIIWIEFDDDETQNESDSDDNEAQEESDSELKIVKVESLQGKEAEKFI